jgi:hypothetical protein
VCYFVIATSVATEAIHLAAQKKNGLLRFARNGGGSCGNAARAVSPKENPAQF